MCCVLQDGDARIAVGGRAQGADLDDQQGKQQADGDSSDGKPPWIY